MYANSWFRRFVCRERLIETNSPQRVVRSKKQSGKHHDSGGLHLQVTPRLTRSWLFRYYRDHDVQMGLGSFPDVPLAKARIDTGLVLKVLQPIWYTKTETATRVRQWLVDSIKKATLTVS